MSSLGIVITPLVSQTCNVNSASRLDAEETGELHRAISSVCEGSGDIDLVR